MKMDNHKFIDRYTDNNLFKYSIKCNIFVQTKYSVLFWFRFYNDES